MTPTFITILYIGMLPWQFNKWVWCLLPVIEEYVEETVIAGDLRFKIVRNSHFYNISIHRNVVVAIVKVGVVSPPRNGRIC